MMAEDDVEGTEDLTQLLRAWVEGDRAAEERLMARVYGDRRYTVWNDRVHFFAVAARIMRRVLVDHAKARRRAKRGSGAIRVTLRLAEQTLTTDRGADLEALEDALQDLTDANPRLAKIVQLRFFGGLSVKETARALKRSERSIARDWRLAKAWLVRELTGEREDA